MRHCRNGGPERSSMPMMQGMPRVSIGTVSGPATEHMKYFFLHQQYEIRWSANQHRQNKGP